MKEKECQTVDLRHRPPLLPLVVPLPARSLVAVVLGNRSQGLVVPVGRVGPVVGLVSQIVPHWSNGGSVPVIVFRNWWTTLRWSSCVSAVTIFSLVVSSQYEVEGSAA